MPSTLRWQCCVMARPGNNEPVARLLYRVTEVAEALSLSRAKVYELITSGALRSVRIDGARRIRAADLEAFVQSLDSEAA
jgi:excisionase family DNA binding protein